MIFENFIFATFSLWQKVDLLGTFRVPCIITLCPPFLHFLQAELWNIYGQVFINCFPEYDFFRTQRQLIKEFCVKMYVCFFISIINFLVHIIHVKSMYNASL